jgi:hypothetical protein
MQPNAWPDLILHFTTGGAIVPGGGDADPELRNLARAWRAGDAEACLALSLPLFDALDARRAELLGASDFPPDPSAKGAVSPSMTEWLQCAVAQASVGLTLALSAWLLERSHALAARVPGLIEAAYPQWSELFPAGPFGESYSGPHCIPRAARAAVLASLLIAEDLEPGVIRRSLGSRTSIVEVEFLGWLIPLLRSEASTESSDPRVQAVATIHAIITGDGAGLGIVEDPIERRIAAAAHGSVLEDAWLGYAGGPFARAALERASRGLASDRRTALADRLRLIARYQRDPVYQERLREFAARLTGTSASGLR